MRSKLADDGVCVRLGMLAAQDRPKTSPLWWERATKCGSGVTRKCLRMRSIARRGPDLDRRSRR
jgi:hypothetical protein